MKKILVGLVMAGFALTFHSCKSAPKDADIKADAEKALAADPSCSGISVNVDKGVATMTGEVKDESTRTMAQSAVAGVKGVKSVQNNTTVAAPPPTMPPAMDMQGDAITKAVNDAIKDYPGVKASVSNQVVTLTGDIKKSELQKLMMSLEGLKSMGVKSIDSKGLVKK